MTHNIPDTIAHTLFCVTEHVDYRISSGLLDSFSEWWHMPALVACVATVAAFVLWAYHLDAAEIPRWKGAPLALLRIFAWIILLLGLLDISRTAEHEISFPSRVAVLVDGSASMTLAANAGPDDTTPNQTAGETSRAKVAKNILHNSPLVTSLREVHEVSVWNFSTDSEKLVLLPQETQPTGRPVTQDASQEWHDKLLSQGTETRLGDALLNVMRREPDESLAGIILLTDGGNNSGMDPIQAAATVANSSTEVHVIGLGSERLPANVRVADLLAPPRIFPGDSFSITGYLQSQGLEGEIAQVELLEAEAGTMIDASSKESAGRIIDTTEVRLAADGELLAVRFDLDGLDNPGSRVLAIRVIPPQTDSRSGDNLEAADIEVVDAKTQVLLLSGGPSREYRFLRNVLQRDQSFAVDVLLNSAPSGISQDARKILDGFPESREALDEYDVIVAIDYDWEQLDPASTARLERWVSEDSGGLFFVAGNVFMESWLTNRRFEAIRNLHPVELRRGEQIMLTPQLSAIDPLPLRFSPDGNDSEFLWLSSNPIASQTIWSEFPGFYACFDTSVAKPGATVYARIGRDEGLGLTRGGPIYFAGQLYGSGTVFYAGSGELWRIRGVDPAAHERLVTQTVRHVAKGRLLRGSSRGRLMLERDRYPVGETIIARIMDTSEDIQPEIEVISPDGQRIEVPIVSDPVRAGGLQGSFIVSNEGSWQIVLTIDGNQNDRTIRRIQATLPDRELAHPKLEREVLSQVAMTTGGSTWFPTGPTMNTADITKMVNSLKDRSRKEYETGENDKTFKKTLNTFLLGIGIFLLCIEWILRRLVKLA
jgi:hypothetical protein